MSPRRSSPTSGDADYKGNYFWPMYGRQRRDLLRRRHAANEKDIKFGGPEVMKSVNNIWKISDKGGEPVQVTHHTDGNLFFPDLRRRQDHCLRGELRHLEARLATGKIKRDPVDIKSDVKENDIELSRRNEAEGFNISPSNQRAAIAAHGEIFTIATDRGESSA